MVYSRLQVLVAGVLLVYGCASDPVSNTTSSEQKPIKSQELIHGDSIQLEILEPGYGKQIAEGSVVVFHVQGAALPKKRVFIHTGEEKRPLVVEVGQGMVVPGLEQALLQLKEGASFEVIVPWDLGYGDTVYKRIPPRTDLWYSGSILEVRDAVPPLDTAGVKASVYPSGLRTYSITPGDGARPKAGQAVTVHYNGYFSNGKKFDSSYDRRQPLRFEMGAGQVIRGVEDAIEQMRLNGRSRVKVPYQLGYGEYAVGNIPARSDLIYDLELVAID